MSAAPLAAETGAAPGSQNQGAYQRGRLLGLVRKLLDHGRDFIASLQRQNTPTPSTPVARCFGTFNLAVIIARITRGLLIATALEARLVRSPPAREMPRTNPDRPPAPPSTRPARPRPVLPPPQVQPDDDAALPANLPSAEDIAARIRGRPAGAVIVEICRDLGIDASHPLWREIRDAIIAYDGSLVHMLKAWMDRIPLFLANPRDGDPAPPLPSWAEPLVASTGPP